MLLALALLACQELLPDDTAAASDTATSDTGTDTELPLDTFDPPDDTDTDTGAPPSTSTDEGPCPAYSGIGPTGSSRSYRSPPGDDLDSWWTTTTTHLGADGHATVLYDATYRQPDGYESYATIEFRYRCDADGAWLLSYHQVGTYEVSGVTHQIVTDATYTSPALGVIHDLQPGDSWTTSFAYTVSTRSSQTGETTTSSHSGHTSFVVGPERTVTVPAGSFDVLRIDAVADSTYPYWTEVHEDIGSVRAEAAQLTATSGL